MKKTLLLLLLIPCSFFAQPVLLPHIGLSAAPSAADPICSIPVYTGEMDTSGFDVGNTVPDFTLYKANGDSVRLSDELSAGLPVLLVGGNYTCPRFREKIGVLNDITTYYAGQLKVYVIYGVEAHPVVDPSPYSGFVWVTSENSSEGVLYEQPDTYGERLELIDSLLANYTIIPEILVDGPCNPWWLNYGPAPNNAYLIDTSGVVRAKHGWFHRTPENIWCDIDSLLGTSSGNCIISGNNGVFSWTLDADSTDVGAPGEVLAIHGVLQNLSLTENVELGISKQLIDIPGDWATALCGDICYSTSVTNTTVTLAPGDDLPFTFYFYSGATADSGFVRVRFKNLNIAGNMIFQQFIGLTEETIGIRESEEQAFSVFPNPVREKLTMLIPSGLCGNRYGIYDLLGRQVISGSASERTEIVVGALPPGVYFLRVNGSEACHKIIHD